MNSVQRMRFQSLADKELSDAVSGTPRGCRISRPTRIPHFWLPVLSFYKRGLMKDDLKGIRQRLRLTGLLGRTIVVTSQPANRWEAEIRNGRMVPLGYVKVSDGKGWAEGLQPRRVRLRFRTESTRGQTAMILYGLKACADYSATIEHARSSGSARFEQGPRAAAWSSSRSLGRTTQRRCPCRNWNPRLHLGEAAREENFVDLLAPWWSGAGTFAAAISDCRPFRVRRQPWTRCGRRFRPAAFQSRIRPAARRSVRGSSFRYVALQPGSPPRHPGHRDRQPRKLAKIPIGFGRVPKSKPPAGPRSPPAVPRLRSSIPSSRRNGRLELGPLVRTENGPVLGAGLRTTESGLRPVFAALDRLPVTERARLDQDHYAGAVLELDVSGDGRKEQVAVSLEFPPRRNPSPPENPITGVEEVEVYRRGHLRDRITRIGSPAFARTTSDWRSPRKPGPAAWAPGGTAGRTPGTNIHPWTWFPG